MERSEMRRWLAGLVLAPLLGGCAGTALLGPGAAAGAGTYAYAEGEASQALRGGFDPVWDSTLAATQQMDLQVLDTKRDALSGTIEARSLANDDSVTIRVEPVDAHRTRVKVRIGVLGNEEESQRLLRQIDERSAGSRLAAPG